MNQSILLILIIGLAVLSTAAFAANINFIDVVARHWGASQDVPLDCNPDPVDHHCTNTANLDSFR